MSYESGNRGRTPLNTAVKNGKIWIAKILVEHGADPNFQQVGVKDPDYLALSLAIYDNNDQMAKWLLEVKADVKRVDEASLSYPLHTAVNKDKPNLEMVRMGGRTTEG